jgi:hypothetical protein
MIVQQLWAELVVTDKLQFLQVLQNPYWAYLVQKNIEQFKQQLIDLDPSDEAFKTSYIATQTLLRHWQDLQHFTQHVTEEMSDVQNQAS